SSDLPTHCRVAAGKIQVMADLAQLESALIKADAAGDTDGARVLAAEVRKQRTAKVEPSLARKFVDYNPGVGITEAALSLGSGAAGSVAGGISGLATAATNALGITDTPPGDRVRQVSDAMAYEPRTRAGQALTAGAALPFEALASLGDKAGGALTDYTKSPAAGAAVNTLIQAAPAAVAPIARAIPGESAASIAARAAAKKLNAPQDAGVARSRAAGLVTTPS